MCSCGSMSRLSTPPIRRSASRCAGVEPTSQSRGASSAGPNRVAVVESVLEELARARLVERLGEQVGEVVHDDAPRLELADEGVVLLLRPFRPHDVVEQQVVDVVRA